MLRGLFYRAGLAALLLAVGGFAPAAHGQNSVAFAFLRLDAAPRAAALAGALDAVPTDDPAALFHNPALLSPETSGSVGLTYLNHLSDQKAGTLAYGRTVAGYDAAVGVRYFGYGELEGYDEAGVETGSFSAGSLALTVGAAKAYDARLRLGAALSLVTTSVETERATALGADLGASYTLPGALTVSAVARGLGITLGSLGTTKDVLPLDLRVGVSKRLQYLPLLVTVTGYDLQDPGAGPDGRTGFEQVIGHVGVGGELQFSRAFQVRAGFNPRRNQEMRSGERLDPAGLGLGFGLRVRRYALDYGWASWSEVGGLHHLGLRARL